MELRGLKVVRNANTKIRSLDT